MKKIYIAICLLVLSSFAALAQPNNMSVNQDVGGAYSNFAMAQKGGAFRVRFVENTSQLTGVRNWQFNSDGYNNQWGTVTSGPKTLSAFNTLIAPLTTTASANWTATPSASAYNAFGKLPATVAGTTYTYNLPQGVSYASQYMSVLATTYAPVSIPTVTSVNCNNNVRVNVTTSATPNALEYVYVRYSTTSNFITSTLVQVQMSGATGSVNIPVAPAATIYYYALTSNQTAATIATGVAGGAAQNAYDLYTLDINNNTNANYTYTAPAATNFVGGTTYSIPTDFTNLACFVSAWNNGTISGAGNITLNIPSGYTETAPVEGYVITKTATLTTPLIIKKNGATANPTFTAYTPQVVGNINDGIIKLIGTSYVTIDGLTLLENAGNTIPGVAGVYTTNNMTEFGIALLYSSSTIGSQNNTIQNCTITLNRASSNTFGIYSNARHSSTSFTVTAEAIAASGTNSFNKVYSNTISNVNYGIVFVGSGATTAVIDNGNDIGGTSISTGNTITNFGGIVSGAASGYTSVTASSTGIFMNNQINDIVSFNSVTSATNITTITTQGFTGIIKAHTIAAPTGITITSTYNNNNVTLTNTGATTSQMTGMGMQGLLALSTSTFNMNNNNIVNCAVSGATITSATMIGILNSSAPGTFNVTGNTIKGFTSAATSGGFVGIQQQTNGVVNNLNITNNKIGDALSGAVTFSAATSGAIVGIAVTTTGIATTCASTITGNDFRGIVHSVAGSSSHTYINMAGTPLTNIISSNTYTNLIVNTTGTVVFIAHSYSMPTNGTQTFNANSIITAFSKTGAGGSVTCFTSGGSSPNLSTSTMTNNIFSNITVTGATTILGISNTDGSGTSPNRNVTGNTFSNWTGGSGSLIGISFTYIGATSTISNNTLTGYTGTAAITGITIGNSFAGGNPLNINNNIINNYTSSGTGGTVLGISCTSASPLVNINNHNVFALSSTAASVTGLLVGGGATTSLTNAYKNNIFNISSTNAATPIVSGISVTAGNVNVFNNLVSGLNATAASSGDAVRGIGIPSTSLTSTINVHNNTVYLTGTTSGANFGSSGVYHAASATATTVTLDLRNNLIVNLCTPKGTGVVSALRRSAAATLGNYATASNRNSLYAGTPSAFNTLMYDGTTGYQTIATYKTAVAPTRDVSSFTEGLPTYDYTATTGATQFFTELNPTLPNFLKPLAGLTTQLESGGSNPTSIAALTDDYFGVARPVTPATTMDIGAWEFAGVTPAPSITLTSISPAATAQCVKAARVVTVTVTNPGAITTTGVVINYSHNGTAQTPVTMTNTSGNIWTGTMLAPTVGNAIVTWNVVATNSISISATYNGIAYADETNVPNVVTISPSAPAVCAGSGVLLTASGGTITSNIQVGTGTTLNGTTAYPSPFSNYYGGTKHQMIIRASELVALGWTTARPINSIAFNVSAVGSTFGGTLNSFQVDMANTASTVLGSVSFEGSLTNVRAASNLIVPTTGLPTSLVIPITPFTWNGTSNLVIQTSYSNNSSGTSTTFVQMTNSDPGFVSTNWIRTDGVTAATILASTTPTSSGNARPNITLNGSVINPITWSPTTNLFTDAALTTAYTGTATNTIYAAPASTQLYTATATSSTSCLTTANVTVTVNPLPTAPTSTGSVQCGAAVPTAVVVDPNGFVTPTFKWYAAASGGVALQSSTSNTYLLSTSSSLYVTVLNPTTGCESPRTLVNIIVSAPLPLAITTDATICNGAIVPISVSSTIANFDSYIFSTPASGTLFLDAAGLNPYMGTNLYVDAITPVTVYFKRSGAASLNAILCTAYNSVSTCGNTATSNQTVMPIPTISSTGNNYCLTGSPTLSLSPATGFGAGTIQWQASTDAGATYTNVGTLNSTTYVPGAVTTTTIYKVIISNSNTVACGIAGSEPSIAITVNNPMVTSTTPATRCGTGPITLSATASGTLNWYAASTGGASLATGTSYTIPSIAATTTYYVGAANIGSSNVTARIAAANPGTATNLSTYGLDFTLTAPIKLNSLDVFSSTGTAVTIKLFSAGGVTELQTSGSVSTTAGVQSIIPLNWLIPAGTYRLFIPAMTGNYYRENSGPVYPVALNSTLGSVGAVNGFVSTLTGTVTTSASWYFMYNWNISSICENAVRTAVTATVTPAPAINATVSAPVICSGLSTNLNVTSANDPNYTYTWTPGALSGATQTVSPAAPTTYTVNATDASGGANNGCAATASVVVTVNPSPTGVSANVSAPTICAGGSTILTGSGTGVQTLVNEGFEGTPVGWIVANGGSPDWFQTNLPSGSAHSGTGVAEYLYSSTVAANSWMFAPPQNLIAGVTYNVSSWYRGSGTTFPERLKVTVGTSNTIAAQTTTITDLGTITNSTYLQQNGTFTPSVSGTYYFAWNAYSLVDEYYINVDDILITRGTTSYAWTSTPAGFTSAVQNPGAQSPLVNTTYNLVVTGIGGCTTSANVAVVVNPTLPASVTIAASPSGAICSGTSVTFTATPTNGGSTPTYVWKKGGAAIPGQTAATYTTTTLANGDAITVTMTSNATPCLTGSPATSAAITMVVNPNLPASVTIAASPSGAICAGTSVTFTATPTNGGTPTYVWKKGGVAIIPAETGVTYTTTTLANGDVITVEMTSIGTPCVTGSPATSASIIASVNPAGTWLGVNTDWNNTSNWCGGVVPTSATNVTIPVVAPGNFYPSITAATSPLPNANNVTIAAAGASTPIITVGTGAVFNLYGSISGAGKMDIVAGTLNAVGSPSVINGASLVNNTIKVLKLSGNTNLGTGLVKVVEQIDFVGTGFTFNTNDNLVLLSTSATSTANLGVTTGNTIIGKVEIQRFLPANKSWRLLATPVVIATSPTITDSWREGGALFASTGYGTRITGADGPFQTYGPAYVGAFLDEYTPRTSMKSYNSAANTFTDVLGIDIQTGKKIANNEGYYVFIRGDRGVSTAAVAGSSTTLRIKGEVRTGPQTFTVAANKLNTFGNPFPSRIDLRGLDLTGVTSSYFVWDPNPVGTFTVGKFVQYIDEYAPPVFMTHNFTTTQATGPIPVQRNFMESGEAFFLQNPTGTDFNFTIAEADKGTGGGNFYSRPGVNSPTLELNLFSKDATGNELLADGAKINFHPGFTSTIDVLDVRKVANTFDNLSIKSNTQNLIVERRKPLQETDTIQLNISGMRTAAYKLEIDPSVLANVGLTATLKDRFLNSSTTVSLTNVTNVDFNITTDVLSKAADRFYIVFKAVPTVTITSIAATRNVNKTVAVKWAVTNEVNVTNYTIEHSNDGINFTAIGTQTPTANNGANLEYPYTDVNATSASNWYRINANTTAGRKYSSIAMVNALTTNGASTAAEINIFPNPVYGKTLNISFTNKIGKYNIVLQSAEGREVYNDNVTITGTDVQKKINLTNKMPAGKYNVVIVSTDGVKQIIPVIIL